MQSLELFEGFKIVNYSKMLTYLKRFSEAKKESFVVVKAEAAKLREELNGIIEKHKEKLERIAEQNSDKISDSMMELEKYFHCMEF